MRRILFFIITGVLLSLLSSCVSTNTKNSIASLRNKRIEIKEEKIEGGLEKAMESYQRFVEESPKSALTPEAIRRLADLKLEKEYGTLTQGSAADEASSSVSVPEVAKIDSSLTTASKESSPTHDESDADFEKRATLMNAVPVAKTSDMQHGEAPSDLERPGAREAIALYNKLLKDYPEYKKNDQVLYQLSRAYEELGQVEEAMGVLNRMVRDVPDSRFIDEVQFRRAEYFFVRRKYIDAEEAYASIVKIGDSSNFYELALYKLGWTFYKQEMYEDSLNRFIALLDHKVKTGYDFGQTDDEQEKKRSEDTFRVISLSFSNIGGSSSVVNYFSQKGKRIYEDKVYGNLGEFYFDKRRYADAAGTYEAFVERNPFHKVAPNYHMRVIEIQAAGGFPSLVLESKKKFATTYGLTAEYWKYFNPNERPDVLGLLKTNLTDLAHYYHASYQNRRLVKDKSDNFNEARHWYSEYLKSFPKETESPAMNFQLASLLVENKWFGQAAVEFEKTAYNYPVHEKSSQAGYAAVAAYREQLKTAAPDKKDDVRKETVRSSLTFADTFPEHEKAAIILGAAVDDLYAMKEYERAIGSAKKLITVFPKSDVEVIRDAWLVIGHSAYEILQYSEAESAYENVLALLPKDDKKRDALVDNLAAAIYKQGEQANAAKDYRSAADHFLRVSSKTPTSKIRPTAEYDAAAALIQLKDWTMAASVLVGFRTHFANHELQPEVTKKLAFVYKENNQYALAADEYERIETESKDDAIRGEALLLAADLHEKAGNTSQALIVYRRYVEYFPKPVDLNLSTRSKVAKILKEQHDDKAYLKELKTIVDIDAKAGKERTEETRYLAAQAYLVLAERDYDAFIAIKLVNPIQKTLINKRKFMKTATTKFKKLMDYEIGETTAAATFYLAEIYAHFSKALMTSERPEGLSDLELEQYNMVLEEQAYPFEEQAIQVHENNLKLMSMDVYNPWIDKSLRKLAVFVPASYDKPEESIAVISSLDTFVFEIEKTEQTENTTEVKKTETNQVKEAEVVAAPEPEASAQPEEAASVSETKAEETTPEQKVESTVVDESEKKDSGNESDSEIKADESNPEPKAESNP